MVMNKIRNEFISFARCKRKPNDYVQFNLQYISDPLLDMKLHFKSREDLLVTKTYSYIVAFFDVLKQKLSYTI
jgi:hypothetical protein